MVMTDLANGQVSIDRLAQMFVQHVPDSEYCEECFAVFIWDQIPDEFIHMGKEKHPYGSTYAYEDIVIGWTCPVCGYKTNF
jgi:hypothetical protein